VTDSRERFVRLAEARTRKAIKMVRLIGNLSNRSNYSYKQEDVDKIFRALELEVRKARARFAETSRAREDLEFSL
jgi:hypothetical protein